MKKIEIDYKLLERIAKYYEFPVATFFMQVKNFPKPETRYKSLLKRIKKIKTIIKEM